MKKEESQSGQELQQRKPRSASLAETFRHATAFDWLLMLLGTVGAVVTGLSLPASNVLFGRILDELNENPEDFADEINYLCILFVIIAGINLLSGFLQVSFWAYSGERQAQKFREEYVNSILSMEIGWFDTIGAGELSTKVTDLSGRVQDGMGRKAGDLISFIVQFVGSFAAAFYLNWELTLVLLGTLPIITLSGALMVNAVTAVTTQVMEQYASAGSVATEALGAIRTVAALNAQPYFIDRYREHIVTAMRVGIRKGFNLGFGHGAFFGAMMLTYGLGFWYGARLVIRAQQKGEDSPTGGDVMAVFFTVIMGGMALGQLGAPLMSFTAARAAIGSMLETINRRSLINSLEIATSSHTSAPDVDAANEEKQVARSSGSIQLKDVTFAYPARPNIIVCNKYSLNVAPGESVALVGASGCGKSTIVQLLLRFYDPSEGTILLDGRDIRSVNIRWLRSQIGYVGQEPVLFAGSVRDNIAYGLDAESNTLDSSQLAARQEQIIAAAKLANAHEFICNFPQGYDTDVGSNGVAMSGGQKQRIAIARALVKQPSVLLLDEATSALDAASERLVQRSIDDLQRRKAQTTFIIAHRLSTVRNVDKICMLEHGHIIEVGTHNELVALDGKYAELVKSQISGHEEEEAGATESPKKDVADIPMLADEAESVPKSVVGGVDGGEKPKEVMEKTEAVANDKPLDRKLRGRVWQNVRMHPLWFLTAVLGAGGFGAIFPVWGYLLAVTQDMFYKDRDTIREESVEQFYYYVALAVASFVSAILQHWGTAQVGERVSMRLRSGLFEALFRRDIAFFDDEENSIGSLTARLSTDTRLIEAAFSTAVAKQMQAIFCLLVGLVIGFTASWRISLVVLASFPINIAASAIQMQVLAGATSDASDDNEEKSENVSKNHDEKGTAIKKNDASAATNEMAAKNTKATGNPASMISTAFIHMRTVCAFSMQNHVASEYARLTREISKRRKSRSMLAGLGFGGSNFVLFCTYAMLFWYGSTLLEDDVINFEEMMIAILSLMLGALGLGQALTDMGDQQQGLQAAKRIFDSIDAAETSPIDGLALTGVNALPLPTCAARIELRNVHFSYPSRPEVKVCDDYNLIVEPGQMVALVGASGSGKSTIVQLLLRFYDPSEGTILLDGRDIRSVNIRWLRSQIGYVGQEPVLFAGSVRDNVAKGRPDMMDRTVLSIEDIMRRSDSESVNFSCGCCQSARISNETHSYAAMENGGENDDLDIIDACKLSNAHSFVEAFPQGYDTEVGEGSTMVSGGQKQRIAIARALVKRPSVLLLDEATSALDANSEQVVQRSIDDLQRQGTQTTIVIAHRLSTIRNANKICMIENGRIVEAGTHEELLAVNEGKGRYAMLWAKQSGIR